MAECIKIEGNADGWIIAAPFNEPSSISVNNATTVQVYQSTAVATTLFVYNEASTTIGKQMIPGIIGYKIYIRKSHDDTISVEDTNSANPTVYLTKCSYIK